MLCCLVPDGRHCTGVTAANRSVCVHLLHVALFLVLVVGWLVLVLQACPGGILNQMHHLFGFWSGQHGLACKVPFLCFQAWHATTRQLSCCGHPRLRLCGAGPENGTADDGLLGDRVGLLSKMHGLLACTAPWLLHIWLTFIYLFIQVASTPLLAIEPGARASPCLACKGHIICRAV